MAPKRSLLSRIQHKSPFRPKTLPEVPDPLYPPPLPCLAFVRPRPLTAEPQDCPGSADSGFFKKLPYDIRLKIMRFAFGYSGIHVELDFDNPPIDSRSLYVTVNGYPEGSGRTFVRDERSCPDPRDDGYFWHRYRPLVDKRQPKQWRWRNRICARDFSVFDNPQGYSVNWKTSIDACWEFGHVWWQFMLMSEAMSKLGVTGWLLSCRQAYSECVHVLYSANSFIMSNPELILNLPRLWLPSRLACITSLEMTWKIHPLRPQEPDDSVLTDHNTFLRLIDATPTIFPSLLHLFISLQGDMYTDPKKRTDKSYNFSDEAHDKVESVVMKPIEGMLQRFESLRIVVIGLPSSCYGVRKLRAMDIGVEIFEGFISGGGETFWRDVPKIPTKGYWIRLVHRDMGGGDYSSGAGGFAGTPPPREPLDCLYGGSRSPW